MSDSMNSSRSAWNTSHLDFGAVLVFLFRADQFINWSHFEVKIKCEFGSLLVLFGHILLKFFIYFHIFIIAESLGPLSILHLINQNTAFLVTKQVDASDFIIYISFVN